MIERIFTFAVWSFKTRVVILLQQTANQMLIQSIQSIICGD